jgi:single-strand DNA-binding protein
MPSYKLTGEMKLIMDMQTFPSGFSKREFVVTTPDDRFPQDIKLEMVKDKCALLDGISVGQEVEVDFDLRGNEYNDKYYVNLTAWQIVATAGQTDGYGFDEQPADGQPATENAGPAIPAEDDDNLPF